jgi:predicted nucleic acid-binding protein
MIEKVYIDSNIFIWGYNFPKSNSAKILDTLINSDTEIFVSEKVIDELRKYFCTYFTKDIFSEIQLLIFGRFIVVYNFEIQDELINWKNKIKKKDLEHVCIIKKFNIPILVSYDKDFKSFSEYMTPKEFIKFLGLKPSSTDY